MTVDYIYGIVTLVKDGVAYARSFDGGPSVVIIRRGATKRLELRRDDLVRFHVRHEGKRVIAVEPQAYFPKSTPKPRPRKPYYRRLGPVVRVGVHVPGSRLKAAQR